MGRRDLDEIYKLPKGTGVWNELKNNEYFSTFVVQEYAMQTGENISRFYEELEDHKKTINALEKKKAELLESQQFDYGSDLGEVLDWSLELNYQEKRYASLIRIRERIMKNHINIRKIKATPQLSNDEKIKFIRLLAQDMSSFAKTGVTLMRDIDRAKLDIKEIKKQNK